MQNDDKANNMFDLVEQWQQSSKSQKIFSEEHNIKLPTFSYWVNKYRQQSSPEVGFAKVELGQRSGLPKARIEIELADGMVVRIF